MSDEEEGFSNAFARAYKRNSTMIGEMLGGCSPWIVAISVFILACGVVALVALIIWLKHTE